MGHIWKYLTSRIVVQSDYFQSDYFLGGFVNVSKLLPPELVYIIVLNNDKYYKYL